jgi:uncharacterized repeat protein (TIGR03833 family)
MNGINRSNIRIGSKVAIVLKADQPTGKLTEGIVQAILTKSPSHPHGIKVRLESGAVGRVKQVLD